MGHIFQEKKGQAAADVKASHHAPFGLLILPSRTRSSGSVPRRHTLSIACFVTPNRRARAVKEPASHASRYFL